MKTERIGKLDWQTLNNLKLSLTWLADQMKMFPMWSRTHLSPSGVALFPGSARNQSTGALANPKYDHLSRPRLYVQTFDICHHYERLFAQYDQVVFSYGAQSRSNITHVKKDWDFRQTLLPPIIMS